MIRGKMALAVVAFFLAGIVFVPGAGAADKLPIMEGKEVVATVNGEPIALEEFNQGLMSLHGEMGDVKKAVKIDYSEPLRRLINTRLILMEAKNIGLDKLPELQMAVADFSEQALRQTLLDQHTKNSIPDQDAVERHYRDEVREYGLQSVHFQKEEDAARFAKEALAGKDFTTLAKGALDSGVAKGSAVTEYMKKKDLLPEIEKVLNSMEAGAVSPVVSVGGGFAVVKLGEIRYPEDPEARKRVTEMELKQKKSADRHAYIEALVQKYFTLDDKLVAAVDYEAAEPGMEAMLQDKRALAIMKGDSPVTVGELGVELKKKFFHGVEQASAKKGRVNQQKTELLRKIMNGRAVSKEAILQGLDKSAAYIDAVEEYKNSLLFDYFVRQAIIPGIQLEDKDILEYYNRNLAMFSSPELLRLRSLVFARKDLAEAAMAKLQGGTDYKWLAANAEGQVAPDTKGVLKFNGDLLVTTSIPESVQKVVEGAKAGDFRLYAGPEDMFYLLAIEEVVAPKPQELDVVRDGIKSKVVSEKILAGLDEYAKKLRKHYPVKIYIQGVTE